MLYIAVFEYIDRCVESEEKGLCSMGNPAYFTAAVDADTPERAVDGFKDMIADLHERDEVFYDVDRVDLCFLTELKHVSKKPIPLHWLSVVPFSGSYGTIMRDLSDGREGVASFVEGDDEDDEGVEAFVDFDLDKSVARPLYKDLSRRKSRGTLPSFKDLSDGDLYTLYVVEGCINSEIAELFDEDAEKVARRRRKIGADFDEAVLYRRLKDQGLLVVDPDFGDERTVCD